MSLLDDSFESCTLLERRKVDDGYGGYSNTWIEGINFDAAIVFTLSVQALHAEAAGVTSRYRVTTRRNLTLEFHDVFRRNTDGKVFRVTSDGDDVYTPQMATLDMRQVTAEEYTLPDNG